jgi:hypothetical protein
MSKVITEFTAKVMKPPSAEVDSVLLQLISAVLPKPVSRMLRLHKGSKK